MSLLRRKENHVWHVVGVVSPVQVDGGCALISRTNNINCCVGTVRHCVYRIPGVGTE